MVICYLHIECVAIFPDKANTPLVVDGNGMLAGTIASQQMQAVAGRHFKIVEACGQINILQTADRPLITSVGRRFDFPVRKSCLACLSANVLITGPVYGVTCRVSSGSRVGSMESEMRR